MLEIYHCLLPGVPVRRILTRSSAQAWHPGSEGALRFSPVLPALKSSMSGCPFKVGPVGLAPTLTHMVVGAPRSYHTPRALTWPVTSQTGGEIGHDVQVERSRLQLSDQSDNGSLRAAAGDFWIFEIY
jgi:hypothetical protein